MSKIGNWLINLKNKIIGIEDKVKKSTSTAVLVTATQTTTEIDQKFVEVQRYITEAKKVVNTIIANEVLSGEVKNKDLIKYLISDLQATMKLYRPKFMKANETVITVD